MAPKRRTASAQSRSSSSTQQPKLSFSNRVTKPSTTPSENKKSAKKAADLLNEPKHDELPEPRTEPPSLPHRDPPAAADDPLSPSTAPQTTESLLGGRAEESTLGATDGPTGTGWIDDEEPRARKITDVQIKKYWRAKEEARLAPRVHQGDLGLYEKVLREWDVSGEFGPCIGISRLKRWKRANSLGLDPPIEVLAILLKQMDGGGGGKSQQRAYVDELMNSHGKVEA